MKDLAGSTLYYAPGGGLGHMRRAHWVAKQLGFAHDWTLIASPAPHLQAWMADRTRVERIPSALENRRTDLQAWLRDIVDRVRPQRIFVDAFPGGLFGEWCGFDLPPDIEQIHVARLLVWSNYCGRLCEPSPRFDRIYILEPLHQEHEKALNRMSSSVGPLVLEPFVADSETAPPVSSPFWLITHSEPVEEVLELLAHAREAAHIEGAAPSFVLATMCDVVTPGVEVLRNADARTLYSSASRIFSAAGFNTMQETKAWRARHYFIPMPRRLDDQFERARRARHV